MDEKQIKQLLLNQKFYKTNLSLKYLAEDMRNLNEAINKATLSLLSFKDFYKQIKK